MDKTILERHFKFVSRKNWEYNCNFIGEIFSPPLFSSFCRFMERKKNYRPRLFLFLFFSLQFLSILFPSWNQTKEFGLISLWFPIFSSLPSFHLSKQSTVSRKLQSIQQFFSILWYFHSFKRLNLTMNCNSTDLVLSVLPNSH